MYSSWAARRRSKIIFWFGLIGFILLYIYITIKGYIPPSCHDMKKNQNEVGIDCGGPCDLMCLSQVNMPNIVWVRSFEVSRGIWSAIAYTENSNPQAYSTNARYKFIIYDRNNNVIAEREGGTFINENILLPVFESRIKIGDKIPYRTTFKWLGPFTWHKTKGVFNVVAEEQRLDNPDSKPVITAKLVNKDPFLLKDVEVVAVVYDKNQNAISASKTYVDTLSPRGSKNITFIWPHPFTAQPSRWELIPMVPPQKD